jgi:uncharacterized protein (TIGR03643 family)
MTKAAAGAAKCGTAKKCVFSPPSLKRPTSQALALSDHVAFAAIQRSHGLVPDQVKALMRRELKPGSYQAWRKRVRTFSDQRAVYK